MRTYFVLVAYANKQRLAWPAAGTLAKVLQVTERTIFTHLSLLTKHGLIEAVGTKRFGNVVYRLVPMDEVYDGSAYAAAQARVDGASHRVRYQARGNGE